MYRISFGYLIYVPTMLASLMGLFIFRKSLESYRNSLAGKLS